MPGMSQGDRLGQRTGRGRRRYAQAGRLRKARAPFFLFPAPAILRIYGNTDYGTQESLPELRDAAQHRDADGQDLSRHRRRRHGRRGVLQVLLSERRVRGTGTDTAGHDPEIREPYDQVMHYPAEKAKEMSSEVIPKLGRWQKQDPTSVS